MILFPLRTSDPPGRIVKVMLHAKKPSVQSEFMFLNAGTSSCIKATPREAYMREEEEKVMKAKVGFRVGEFLKSQR